MRIVILGPQGCGKGTQGRLLAEALRIELLGMGDILRRAAEKPGQLGREIDAYQRRGDLVPEKHVIKALIRAVHSEAAQDGFVLDGYPRLEHQVDELDLVLGERPLDKAVLLDVPREEAMRRVKERLVCGSCGETHSRREGLIDQSPCSKCGAPVKPRSDDTESALKRRYETYERETVPAVELYARRGLLVTVDGVGTEETVHKRVLQGLGAQVP